MGHALLAISGTSVRRPTTRCYPTAMGDEGDESALAKRADHAEARARDARGARGSGPLPAHGPRGAQGDSDGHRGLAALRREPVADEAADGSAHRPAGADSWRRPGRRRPEWQADDQGPAQHVGGRADQERVRHRSHAPRHDGQQAVLPRPDGGRELRQRQLLPGRSARTPGLRQSDWSRSAAAADRRRAMLRQRIEVMRTLADNTDGIAVVNSNDLDGGMRRISDDLTSYYLLGYYSTNAKLDGRFRSLKVKVKQPGVDVRARRGYRAATDSRGRPLPAARLTRRCPRPRGRSTPRSTGSGGFGQTRGSGSMPSRAPAPSPRSGSQASCSRPPDGRTTSPRAGPSISRSPPARHQRSTRVTLKPGERTFLTTRCRCPPARRGTSASAHASRRPKGAPCRSRTCCRSSRHRPACSRCSSGAASRPGIACCPRLTCGSAGPNVCGSNCPCMAMSQARRRSHSRPGWRSRCRCRSRSANGWTKPPASAGSPPTSCWRPSPVATTRIEIEVVGAGKIAARRQRHSSGAIAMRRITCVGSVGAA